MPRSSLKISLSPLPVHRSFHAHLLVHNDSVGHFRGLLPAQAGAEGLAVRAHVWLVAVALVDGHALPAVEARRRALGHASQARKGILALQALVLCDPRPLAAKELHLGLSSGQGVASLTRQHHTLRAAGGTRERALGGGAGEGGGRKEGGEGEGQRGRGKRREG